MTKEKEEVKIPEPVIITKIIEKDPIVQKVEVEIPVVDLESLRIIAGLFKIG